ncbi:MAG: alanine dehydrogenase [Pseudoclavibacter sp.]|nr:alanine dehydrogenase [Pseudoclavibacter sp.]
MRIGVPTEVKNNEFRIAMTPAGVQELVRNGHEVRIQKDAGAGSGFTNEEYEREGAVIVDTAAEAWDAELVVKVKEPIEQEYGFLREDLTLFAYLHLAADRPLTEALMQAGTTSIAYETVQLPDRSLPLLTPMSEIAGRLSIQVGGSHLLAPAGGRGTLLGGIAGVPKGNVVVIGGGVAGEHAAANALGLGAQVTIIDISLPRLRELERHYGGALQTRASTRYAIAEALREADLVIGSVLIPGAKAPKLVTLDMVEQMKPGSVLVDIAIDQGGCFEGSKPTTHDDPTFRVHDSIYYCVANMPGAAPVTATRSLTNATLPYALRLANEGWRATVEADPAMAAGVSTLGGKLSDTRVGEALGIEATPVSELL